MRTGELPIPVPAIACSPLRRGFRLIHVLAVLAILGVVAALLLPVR